MRLKALASMIVTVALCTALSTPSAAQAEKRMAGGSKSVTGCLVKLDAGGFGLKTDDGTYQINTDRDLSSFVGKQVRIDGTWRASGTVTTAPVGGAAAGGAAAGGETAPAQAPSGAPSASTPAFVGELNLQVTGTVVGDCAAPK